MLTLIMGKDDDTMVDEAMLVLLDHFHELMYLLLDMLKPLPGI
jgi:hypothetical protein